MDRATLDLCEAELCYATLRERIVNAEFLPNTHHLVASLAEKLHLPALDLHNASVRLRDEGLVSLEPRGGFWVTPITPGSIADTFRHVSMLEARAVYIAALHGPTAVAMAALDDSVQKLDDALFRGDRSRWAGACHHFHRSLVQCSGHGELVAQALPLSEPIHRARMVTLTLSPLPIDGIQDRAAIVEAIRCGAAKEGRQRLLSHWQNEASTVIELLQMHRLDSLTA